MVLAAASRSVGDQARPVALLIARARVGLGAAMLVGAGWSSRLAFGGRAAEGRAAMRLAGGRDVALGLGALTSVRERTQDAEWVGIAAVVDAVDAAVLLCTRGLPVRSRLVGLFAAATAVVGLVAAQRLADERTGQV
jgi:hypothetical protein